MNQGIHKLIEKYEADRNYYLTDRRKELLQRSNFELSSYVCTDPDGLQFGKKVNEYCWHYIQVIDDGPFHKVILASVDLNDYSETQIEQCIHSFGYTIIGDSHFINIKKEKGYDWQQLCCECLFEEMIPELLS
jgi:hypothetical protein